jgi:hypothetical protein
VSVIDGAEAAEMSPVLSMNLLLLTTIVVDPPLYTAVPMF